jgi:hypothetical protein
MKGAGKVVRLRAGGFGIWAIPAFIGLFGARTVNAQSEAVLEPISVELSAPSECPDTEALFRAIKVRTNRALRAEQDPRVRHFRFEIATDGSRYQGTLSIREAERESSPRRVNAENCEEVIQALSVVAALAVDPPKRPEASQASSAANTSGASPSNESERPAETTWQQPQPARAAMPSRTVTNAASPEDIRAKQYRVGFGVQVGTLTAPAGMGTGMVATEIGFERAGVWAPTVRLGVLRSLAVEIEPEFGSASFTLTEGRLQPCALRIKLSSTMRFLPCVALHGGMLRAESRDVSNSRTEYRPWWAVGLTARAALETGMLGLEFEVGVLVPIQRDNFRFSPDVAVYKFPNIIGQLAVGAVLWPIR